MVKFRNKNGNFVFSKFLFKLILSYWVITMAIIFVITFLINITLSENIREKEIKLQQRITNDVSQYMNSRFDSSQKIIKSVYQANTKILKSVFTVLNASKSSGIERYMDEKSRFESFFYTALYSDKYIENIIIVEPEKGNAAIFSKKSVRFNYAFDFKQYSWFNEIVKNKKGLTLIPSYRPGYIVNATSEVYSMAACIFDGKEKIGAVVIINFKPNDIYHSFQKYKDDIIGSLLVFSRDGHVIYDSSEKYRYIRYPYLSLLGQNPKNTELDLNNFVYTERLSNRDIVVADIIPKSELVRGVRKIQKTIYTIMLTGVVASLFLIFLISNVFSRKVKNVINAMDRAEKGDLDARVKVNQVEDEIDQISGKFNKMCEKLKQYIEKVYLSEIRTKDAELIALQTQINPHFLYNTLEAIRMKAVITKDTDVSDMIFILAKLLRISTKTKDMIITVKDEIEYCKFYLQLHKIRFVDKLGVKLEFHEDILQFGILRMILQPLIENSIKYGFDKSKESLQITVKGHKDHECLVIYVIDNGKGIEQKRLEEIRKNLKEEKGRENTSNIGLKNVDERIRIIFGEKYGLDIQSQEGLGTMITVTIPAINYERMKDIV